MKFKLNSGRLFFIRKFHLRYAYEGLIAGKPDLKLNKKLFDELTHPKSWGNGPLFKIEPKTAELVGKLKPIEYSVLLESAPIKKGYFASHLIVCWFGDEPENKSIVDIAAALLKKIDWKKKARDFEI